MRFKFSFLFTLGFLIVCCNQKENATVSPKPKKSAQTDLKFDGLLPAYSITKDIDAIVLELDGYEEEDLFQNQIYQKVEQEDTLFDYQFTPVKLINSTFIDTSGAFNIYRSEKLEKLIKEKLKPVYYVYGTKGYTKIGLGDVYFTTHECMSNIIAIKLNGYNRERYGFPMFCSEKRLDIVYGTDYRKVTSKINKYQMARCKLADYCNPPNSTKVFANKGGYYFTYDDEFNWQKGFSSQAINFPSRQVHFINDNGKVDTVWGYSLDLLGIPCD